MTSQGKKKTSNRKPRIRAVFATHGRQAGKRVDRAESGDTVRIEGTWFGADPRRVRILCDDAEAPVHRSGFSNTAFLVTLPLLETNTASLRVRVGKIISGRRKFLLRRPSKPRRPVGAATSELFYAIDEYAALTAAFARSVAPHATFGDELMNAAMVLDGFRQSSQRGLEILMTWRDLQKDAPYEALKTITLLDEVAIRGNLVDRVHNMTANVYGVRGILAKWLSTSSGASAIHDGTLKTAIAQTVKTMGGPLGSNMTVPDAVKETLGGISHLLHEHSKVFEGIEGYFKGKSVSVSAQVIDVSIDIGDQISGMAKVIDAIAQWLGVGAGQGPSVIQTVLEILEAKADRQGIVIDEIKDGVDDLGDQGRGIKQETGDIEYKLDLFAKLLGQTLYGKPWHVNPRVTTTDRNEVPEKGIKEEMHNIEALLAQMYFVLTGQPFSPPPPVPTPSPTPIPFGPHGPFIVHRPDPLIISSDQPAPPPPRSSPLLKKIYVYDEGVFEPQSELDEKEIRIRTNAFDVSGWLDLTELRSGDSVRAELHVAVAGQPFRLFDEHIFDSPGLRTMGNFARGQNRLSGNDFKVVLSQPFSSDSFATPIRIAYQFVVESQ